MTLLKSTICCVAITVAAGALAGCQPDPSKHGGTYTAARHVSTGSRIPRPTDIDNANSVGTDAAAPDISGRNSAISFRGTGQ